MGFLPQNDTDQFPGVAFQGQLAEPNAPRTVDSKACEGALDPGLFVVRGTGDVDDGCLLPASAADITNKLLGPVLYREALEPASPNFAIGDVVSVCRKGVVYVLCDGTVVTGSIPFIVFSATGGHTIGAVRADAGAGTIAGVAPSGVRVKRGAGTGAFAAIEVNLP